MARPRSGRPRRRGGRLPRHPGPGEGDPGRRARPGADHHARSADPGDREPARGARPEAVPARPRPHVGAAGVAGRDGPVPAGRHRRAARQAHHPLQRVSRDDRAVHRHAAGGDCRWPHRCGRPGAPRDRADRSAPGHGAGGSSGRVHGTDLRRGSAPRRGGGRGACLRWSPAAARLPGRRIRAEGAPAARAECEPDGEAAYRLAIRMQTTVDTTAEEVHAFGLADLESIEAEKDEIARRLGHADRHALREALIGDESNHTSDPQAIVRLAQDQTDRAYAAAPTYFGRIPSANCYVKSVEPYREAESPPAFYMPPSLDGSRQGQYYINTYQPEDRQLHKIAAITFHEATPGHHFQIGIEMELQGLPAFRTLGARMAGSAYVEGWGLYTERLADEMGLYANEQERLGMLDAQSFRAARLVVDSGLHAMNWTREQAIAFMHERGSLPMVDAEIEVDRYTVWPGQALAYKIGQREIERARAEVTEKMGDRFDLRAFHDEVLGHGSLPLATLRREILGWVEAVVADR